MDMKLEVVVIPVSDVDRAKRFYEKLGFRLDVDYRPQRGLPGRTVHSSGFAGSILFGKGVTSAQPGSIDRLLLAVYDIDAARQELLSHGVEVSEVFHDAGGGLGGGFYAGTEARAAGSRSPTPFLRLVCLVQRSRRQRLAAAGDQGAAPGPGVTMDVAALAQLLHETAEHHGSFEAVAPPHDWWDWYAAYMDARERGSTPEEASAAAARYMAEVKHVVVSPA